MAPGRTLTRSLATRAWARRSSVDRRIEHVRRRHLHDRSTLDPTGRAIYLASKPSPRRCATRCRPHHPIFVDRLSRWEAAPSPRPTAVLARGSGWKRAEASQEGPSVALDVERGPAGSDRAVLLIEDLGRQVREGPHRR